MGFSTTQQFLVQANRSAGGDDYFRWAAVGAALGYSAAQSDSAVRSLGERKLLIVLQDGTARLLDAGRQMAVRLENKSSAPGGATASQRPVPRTR